MTPPGPEAVQTPRRQILIVIGALMLTMLLAALDQTIVSTALPTIVGDLYGRKVVLQGALVLFLIGSALCGLARSMNGLIAFRALQGLGGGLMVSAQAAIGDVVPPRERGRYMGLFGAATAACRTPGPSRRRLFRP